MSHSRREGDPRTEQLAYSEIMDKMLDESARRVKARKVIAVVSHALGRADLAGLVAVDVGSSGGFIADELTSAGATTAGVDIDRMGVQLAHKRFGDRTEFCLARGEALPLAEASVDLVVLNHIYEHAVDPVGLLADIHRVLRPGGVVYLGLGHRWQVIEPHYRLPLLSWLPAGLADSYVRLTRKGNRYHERYYTPRELRRWVAAFDTWDYTLSVIAQPDRFAGLDTIPAWAANVPRPLLRVAVPLVPTYVWVGFKSEGVPTGPPLRIGPRRL